MALVIIQHDPLLIDDDVMPFLQDVRHGLRALAARPAFAIATLLSLTLGVGVNATVFTAANTMLIKPMDVARSNELVRIYRGRHSPFAFDEFLWLGEHATTLTAVIAETQRGASWTLGGEPEVARVSLLSGNAFATLEIVPFLGRLFVRTDDVSPGATPEVVVSHGFWTSRLGSDRGVVGRIVRLNDRAFTVIGVAPASFPGTQRGWRADFFVPLGDYSAMTGTPPSTLHGSLYVSGRLAPGNQPETAEAELASLGRQRVAEHPDRYEEFVVRVRHARGVTEELRSPVIAASAFLLTIAALIMIIAATNVGNVLLARHAERAREIGVRLALGASRGRLVRMLFAESAALAILAAIGAYAAAAWSDTLLSTIFPPDSEIALTFTPDWRVFAYTIATAILALCVFGLIPALQSTKGDIIGGIKSGSGMGHPSGAKLRRRFLTVQVALSGLLLSVAMLFLRGLGRASAVDIGFEPDHVLTAPVDLSARGLSEEAGRGFYQRLLVAARELPGVTSATYSRVVELTGSSSATQIYRVGDDAESIRGQGEQFFNAVGPEYHTTLRIPLLQGRDFAATDVAGSPLVAIVNETFAARSWPGANPIGQRISFEGPQGPWLEVIGLSRDVKYHTLGEERKMFVTVPYTQHYRPEMTLEVRAANAAAERDVSAALGALVRGMDGALPAPRVQSLPELQKVVLLPAKAGAALFGAIGLLAVVLAAVGIAGVAAFTVNQRRREIGVRAALGARPATLLRAVLGETWRAVAIGGAVGFVLSLVAGKLVASQLYGLSFADPVTFVAVPVLLGFMAAVAAFAPARRAILVSPSEALRSE